MKIEMWCLVDVETKKMVPIHMPTVNGFAENKTSYCFAVGFTTQKGLIESLITPDGDICIGENEEIKKIEFMT